MPKRHSALLAVTCMLVGACSTALSPDPSPLITDGATTTTIEQTTDPLSPGEDSTTTTTEVDLVAREADFDVADSGRLGGLHVLDLFVGRAEFVATEKAEGVDNSVVAAVVGNSHGQEFVGIEKS